MVPDPGNNGTIAPVAIVERAGPEMLRMPRGHMMGDNTVRFTHASKQRPKARRINPFRRDAL
ncbi:hypothetical protein C7I87_23925 [Mesorhizobium sp. SARCC-RB16n]|nr:hypothetical protein C7I87_23925 [Mesorhizobium sp. SARCC-RB16n]